LLLGASYRQSLTYLLTTLDRIVYACISENSEKLQPSIQLVGMTGRERQ